MLLGFLGWDGASMVFPLHPKAVARLSQTDHVAQRWFATEPSLDTVKMFVFVQEGTLLLNYELARRRFSRDLIQ
jgi:hypothetical protein